MPGAQVGDQLGDLAVGEGVAEGGHLLASVHDLASDFDRGPLLLLPEINQRRAFLSADAPLAVAMYAVLGAKQESPGLLGCLVLVAEEGAGGSGQIEAEQGGKGEAGKFDTGDHKRYFLMRAVEGRRPFGWGWCGSDRAGTGPAILKL